MPFIIVSTVAGILRHFSKNSTGFIRYNIYYTIRYRILHGLCNYMDYVITWIM